MSRALQWLEVFGGGKVSTRQTIFPRMVGVSAAFFASDWLDGLSSPWLGIGLGLELGLTLTITLNLTLTLPNSLD